MQIQHDAERERGAAGDGGGVRGQPDEGSADAWQRDDARGPTTCAIAEATFAAAIALHERHARQPQPTLLAAAADRRARCAAGGKLLVFGNGGSAADAQHVAAELVGRFQRERAAMAAMALTTDTQRADERSPTTTRSSSVFARQVEALGRPGDVAFGITHQRRVAQRASLALEAARRARDEDDRADRRRRRRGRARRPTIHVNVPSTRTPRGCRKCTARCCT